MRYRGLGAALTTIMAAISLAAPAHAMRCESKLITHGDHAARVLRFCGEPIAVEERFVQLYAGDPPTTFLPRFLTTVRVEEWTYNFGPKRLMRTVIIENGVVTDIRTLGYGFTTR